MLFVQAFELNAALCMGYVIQKMLLCEQCSSRIMNGSLEEAALPG